MRLKGTGDDEFELKLVGYEFPHLEDEHDSNWLRVGVAATAGGRSWRTIDSCLLTYEVAAFISWLDALANGDRTEHSIGFMEPNLEFEVQDGPSTDPICLRVYFELECRPGWAPWQPAGARDIWAELALSADDLRQWAADLREQLGRFPPRGGVERKTLYRQWFEAAGFETGG